MKKLLACRGQGHASGCPIEQTNATNPNAARLFQSFLFSVEAQQVLIDACALCSFHALVKEKAGRRPLSTIKLMKTDPAAMEAQREEIKARYGRIFRVR
jgi:iron(III) transport system substrate-binding protein